MDRDEQLTFVDWDTSATGRWPAQIPLTILRDASKEDLAPFLCEQGSELICVALVEIMMHNRLGDAARVARTIVDQHPEVRRDLQASLDEAMTYLLEENLEDIPDYLSEFPAQVLEHAQV